MKSQANKGNLIWGGLLILFGIVGIVETYTDVTAWGWVAILTVAGLGAFGFYLTNREWILLIPAYVMWAIALLVALLELDFLRGQAVPAFVLSAVALPFLLTYLRDRRQWWALIPAYVLLAVGLMVVLLEDVLSDLLIPAYVMFAIALPFFVVYWRDRRQWWALIPGGIMSVVGISFLIAEAAATYVIPVALILVGVLIIARQLGLRETDSAVSEGKKPAIK